MKNDIPTSYGSFSALLEKLENVLVSFKAVASFASFLSNLDTMTVIGSQLKAAGMQHLLCFFTLGQSAGSLL
jgi:hypothetical protein